jgi:hypothetical protein
VTTVAEVEATIGAVQGGAMTQPDVYGPVDLVVIEFPRGSTASATATALLDLVERGIVLLYDLVAVRRTDAGCEEIDLSEADGDLSALGVFAGARSGLLDAEDVADAAEVLEAGTVALIALYENAWARLFVSAAHGEGGQMVATSRLTAQEILDALAAVEAQ